MIYRRIQLPRSTGLELATSSLGSLRSTEFNFLLNFKRFKELLDDSLKKKDYKNFKVLSQSDIVLRWIGGRIGELKWI